MKYIILLFAILASYCVADTVFNESSHRGDVWTIRSKLSILKTSKVPHGHIISNSLTVKWNIKKGRLKIVCDVLCNDDDEFIIRMFDRDSFLIDFVVYEIKPNKYLAGNEYIVPKNVRSDIEYMELVPINDEWLPSFDVVCDDGYIKVPSDTGFPKCIKDVVCDDGYFKRVSATGVSDCIKVKTDCPPSWKNSDGTCQIGW